jgi:Mrp family chromosome partitioning ATPase
LGEYLEGKVAFSKVAIDVGIENLIVVPGFESHRNSSELIASPEMAKLFAQIVSAYSNPILVVDLPAVLSADDALAISPIIDGFLLVVAESETVREDVSKAMDVLREATLFGVVHNKAAK